MGPTHEVLLHGELEESVIRLYDVFSARTDFCATIGAIGMAVTTLAVTIALALNLATTDASKEVPTQNA